MATDYVNTFIVDTRPSEEPSMRDVEHFLTISSLSMNNRIPNQIFDNIFQ